MGANGKPPSGQGKAPPLPPPPPPKKYSDWDDDEPTKRDDKPSDWSWLAWMFLFR